MKPTKLLRGSLRQIALAGLLCAGSIFAGSMVLSSVAAAQAQTFRSVDGKVLDKANEPMKGAVVYLKDDHTLAVKSYIAGDDGSYHFGQLSPSTDYTLWAEANGKKSGNKSISSFDSRDKYDYTLTVK